MLYDLFGVMLGKWLKFSKDFLLGCDLVVVVIGVFVDEVWWGVFFVFEYCFN